MDMRTQYREELNSVMEDVVAMGEMVINSLKKGLKSLVERDIELANKVIDEDVLIDRFQLDIEDRVTLLIAKETLWLQN